MLSNRSRSTLSFLGLLYGACILLLFALGTLSAMALIWRIGVFILDLVFFMLLLYVLYRALYGKMRT